MAKETDLNMLVSNVLSENHHKHCRLCLTDIQNSNFVRFGDCVTLDEHKVFQPLSEILSELLGAEICQDIPGIDGVCLECVEKVLACSLFLQSCKESNEILNKIFDKLSEALNIKVEDSTNQRLYVILHEQESKVILVDKEQTEVAKHSRSIHKQPQVTNRASKIISAGKEQKEVAKQSPETQPKVTNTASGENTCDLCEEVFTDNHSYLEHKKNAVFKCANTKCGQYRCSEKSLKEHQYKDHTVHICKHCGELCRGLDKLESHEKTHFSKFSCPKCKKSYLVQASYKKHVELCLAEKLDPHPYRGKYEKTYFCEKCGKGYSTPGGLRVHERFEHGNATPHVCEHCGKKFTAPSYLKVHMVRHTGEKNFDCRLCSKRFVSKEALLYHTRRHTGEKPFSCNLCSDKFVNASARAEHIKFKHTGPKLTCDICKRLFFTSSFLRLHRSRHYDPMSKLYMGRNMIPPNVPGDENIRNDTNDLEVVIEYES